jgi:hypothetical protein
VASDAASAPGSTVVNAATRAATTRLSSAARHSTSAAFARARSPSFASSLARITCNADDISASEVEASTGTVRWTTDLLVRPVDLSLLAGPVRNATFSVIGEHLDRPTSLELIGDTAYVVTLCGKVRRVDHVQSHGG